MANSKSSTSILAMSFGHFGVLAIESRATDRYGKVTGNEETKAVRLYPGVWVAFSGNSWCSSEAMDELPLMLSEELPNPNNMIEIADLVTGYLNDTFGTSKNLSVTVTLIGSIGNVPNFVVMKISQDYDHDREGWYYPRSETLFSCDGSGDRILLAFALFNRFHVNMSYEEASTYASHAIWAATQLDWASGGEIKVMVLLPGPLDLCTVWTQENLNRCRDRYTIKDGPYVV